MIYAQCFKKQNKFRSFGFLSILIALTCVSLSMAFLTSCHKVTTSKSKTNASTETLPDLPFAKAGSLDETAVDSLRGLTSLLPPAAVRPDPDLFVRRLLRQYRADGTLLAREIGRVEDYRLLLGGATENFSTVPQETYDSTSLLASQTVAAEICAGLVAPNSYTHPGWNTILPNDVADVSGNVLFLAQRIIGIPTQRLSNSALQALQQMVGLSAVQNVITLESYIPACIALTSDAEALLL